jgi:hypothetical protein
MTDGAGNRLERPVDVNLGALAGGRVSRQNQLWIKRTVVAQEASEDALTAECREEPTTILGSRLSDDEVLMAREG